MGNTMGNTIEIQSIDYQLTREQLRVVYSEIWKTKLTCFDIYIYINREGITDAVCVKTGQFMGWGWKCIFKDYLNDPNDNNYFDNKNEFVEWMIENQPMTKGDEHDRGN